MRYAVLADIHANLHALSAVLDKLSGEGLDGYLCAGDLVGYGPQPNECVELIAELGATCVAGNHDLIAIGRLGNERCSTLARTSLEWTSATLQPAARSFLAALPLRAHAAGGVVLSHGSLEDPQEYVTRPAQVRAQLHDLNREHPSARLLVLGHTHIPGAWDRDVAAHWPLRQQPLELVSHPWLLNPGSVGQSRERRPNARFMLLDLEREQVTFRAISYDVDGCRRELRRVGLPEEACHLRPRPKWRRTLGRLARRHLVSARRTRPGRES